MTSLSAKLQCPHSQTTKTFSLGSKGFHVSLDSLLTSLWAEVSLEDSLSALKSGNAKRGASPEETSPHDLAWHFLSRWSLLGFNFLLVKDFIHEETFPLDWLLFWRRQRSFQGHSCPRYNLLFCELQATPIEFGNLRDLFVNHNFFIVVWECRYCNFADGQNCNAHIHKQRRQSCGCHWYVLSLEEARDSTYL